MVGLSRVATLVGYSVAALLGTYAVVLPALDNSLTVATVCLTVCVLAWTAARRPRARARAPVAVLPLAGTAVLPAVALSDLAGSALRATFGVGDSSAQPFDVHVASSSTWVSPWLAVPVPVVLAAAGCAVVALSSPLRRTAWLVALALAAVVGAAAALPLYDVPLAAVVALLAGRVVRRLRGRRAPAGAHRPGRPGRGHGARRPRRRSPPSRTT